MSEWTVSAAVGLGVLAISLGIGCSARRPAPLLVFGTHDAGTPTIERVPLALDEDELVLFRMKQARLAADDSTGDPQDGIAVSFAETVTPFESFIHAGDGDRFVLPGFWALSRTGETTADPPHLVTPPSARPRSNAELRSALGRSECPVVIAARYAEDSISVLCTTTLRTRQRHRVRNPDMLMVERLDARTLALVEELVLPVAPGWDARGTLENFLRSGDVVIAIDSSARFRWWLPIPRPRRALHPTLRIDSRGEVNVLRRRRWYSATVTPRGEVVGVVTRAHGAELLGLGPDGERRFRVELEGPGIVAAHSDGACILEAAWRAAGATVQCFDREGRTTWERRTPAWITDWMVDDAGWVYLVATYDRGKPQTLVAVNPSGSIAWSLPADPPRGGMMAAGDDLCFVTEAGEEPSAAPPELVCIGPRHGRK